MIRDITIGQYYPIDSILHRLDPRVKLLGTFLYIICLFIVNHYTAYIIVTLFLFSIITLSKVPLNYIIKGLRPILILLVFTVGFNLFLTAGTPVVEIGFLTITEEGIAIALKMGFRLVFLIIGSSIMTYTTTPNQLTDGLESLLGPLNKVKVPVHEISMMMSIALRFIPILVEETDKIMKAQMARGADFESGNIIQRVKSLIPILVPLFVSAFRRANDLAMAMEARCYRGGKDRSKMKPLKYKRIDRISYSILILFLVLIISTRIVF